MTKHTIPAKRYGGPAIHPGVILRDEFMVPHDLTAYALAKALHVPQTRLSEIIAGRRAITADTALRLARHFGTSPGFWTSLQSTHGLRRTELDHGSQITAEVEPLVVG
ncbi:MAG: HigA family addiction module antitoxin [Planctomycetota bacterium]